MKMEHKAFLTLAVLAALGTSAFATPISLTTDPYTQNFDTLANTGTSSTLPNGWLMLETGTGANTTYSAGTGSSTAGDTYSFGASGSTERALGGMQSGSVVPTIGASFTNNTGKYIDSLIISYHGEQWRLGAASRTEPDRLDFQYSLDATALNSGTWTSVTNLNFNSPVTTGTVGALNGNTNATTVSSTISNLAIPKNATFLIRWNDYNVSGSDDGLAVDDFNLSFTTKDVLPNNSALYIGTAKSTTLSLGRVVRSANATTNVILANRGGGDASDWSAAGSSNPAFGNLANNATTSLMIGTGTSATNLAGGTNFSTTVTLNNTSSETDQPVQVTLTGHVVENRYVNSGSSNASTLPDSNKFGKAIVGTAVTRTITFATTNTQSDLSSNTLTSITLPKQVNPTLVGTKLTDKLTVSLADAAADVLFNDGSVTTTRDLTITPTVAGTYTSDGSNYLRFSTVGEGLAGETTDPNSRIYFTLTALNHGQAQLTTDLTASQGAFDLGTFDLNTGVQEKLAAVLHNIAAAATSADLQLDAVTLVSGDADTLALTTTPSSTLLLAGDKSTLNLNAALLTDHLGVFSTTYTLTLSDDHSVAGWSSQYLTFTLTGTVVPEPASLALLTLGALTLLRRRK